MKKTTILGLSLLFSVTLQAKEIAENWTIRGIIDTYYTTQTPDTQNKEPYPFIYTYANSNKLSLNHAAIISQYTNNKIHGELGLHLGDYPERNYNTEPKLSRNIYSAYIGYQYHPNSWIDIGTFASHIGLESAISKDNWALSRSLSADNTPYFETGIKISYELTPKLTATGLLLNGWQTIKEQNDNKALGTQIILKPTPKLTLNSSTYIGDDSLKNMPSQARFFHNFYAIYSYSDTWSFAGDLDSGWQKHMSSVNSWHSWVLLSKYTPNKTWSFCGRMERFVDHSQSIMAIPNFEATSYSINADYALTKTCLLRGEIKQLKIKNEKQMTIFSTAGIVEF